MLFFLIINVVFYNVLLNGRISLALTHVHFHETPPNYAFSVPNGCLSYQPARLNTPSENATSSSIFKILSCHRRNEARRIFCERIQYNVSSRRSGRQTRRTYIGKDVSRRLTRKHTVGDWNNSLLDTRRNHVGSFGN